jgi:hypothetical protein
MSNTGIIPVPKLLEDLGLQYPTESSTRKTRYGLYECICGATFRTQIASVTNGKAVSCGCYRKQQVSKANSTHKMSTHILYGVWNGMLQRVTNPNHIHYKNYGGKGLTVCDAWLHFEGFYKDMGSTYIEGLSIDRINNDLGYSPDNCRWASNETQSRNNRVIRSSNTSGYRGVSFNKRTNRYQATIGLSGRAKYLGSYKTALEAAKAYDAYVIANNLEHTINGALISHKE